MFLFGQKFLPEEDGGPGNSLSTGRRNHPTRSEEEKSRTIRKRS